MNITLATLHQYSAQDVFDQVVEHLLTQNEKSLVDIGEQDDTENDCVYHNDNGLKCAAGCLISDEEYNKNMEQNTWQNLVKHSKVPSVHAQLIDDLQAVHDTDPTYEWESCLERLAEQEGLEFNWKGE